MSMERKEIQLGEVLRYEQPTRHIVRSSDYTGTHQDTPVLTAGKTFILGYTKEKDGIFDSKKLPVIIFDDFTTASKFVDFPFKVKSSAMKILRADEDKADIRYLYYVMQSIVFPVRKHKRHWISEYSKIKITLPPLPEQKRIADNLDNVFRDIVNTQSLLQKEKASASSLWYSLANKTFSSSDLAKQQLGKCCDVLTGGTPSRSVPEYWNGDIQWMSSGDVNKRVVHEVSGRITKLGMESSNAKLLPKKSVMIALNGQGKTRGMVAITEVELTCNQSLAAIVPKKGSNIDPDYLFWNLYSRYKEIRYLRGGEFRSGLNLSLIRQLDFPVPMKDGKPDLAEQKRIAKELEAAFSLSQRLINLSATQELHFSHLRAATLNKIFGAQTKEETVNESTGNPTQMMTMPRLFDVQQAIAHIIKRFQRGEMVVAKLLYIGQSIYGVPTNLHFTAQNFGPYDSTVKKAVAAGLSSKNDFFAKRGTGLTQVLTLGVNANRILRYSTSVVAQKTNEYLDEMMPYFYQYDSASIELLATLCKVIEDEQTANDVTVKAKLQQWKPNKFADQDVSRTLAFIKKHQWDKRLIKK